MSPMLWICGTKEEIEKVIKDLEANGFTFVQDDWIASSTVPFLPYFCPLRDFRAPAVPTPQPRPWDAVLGGKN